MVEALDFEHPELESLIMTEARRNGKRRNPSAVSDEFGAFSQTKLVSICRSLFCALQICRLRITRLNRMATVKKALEDTLITTVHRLHETTIRARALTNQVRELKKNGGEHVYNLPSDLRPTKVQVHHGQSSSQPIAGRTRNAATPTRGRRAGRDRPTTPGRKKSRDKSPGRPARPGLQREDSNAKKSMMAVTRAKLWTAKLKKRTKTKQRERLGLTSSSSPERSRSSSPKNTTSPPPRRRPASPPKTARSALRSSPRADRVMNFDERSDTGSVDDVLDRINNIIEQAHEVGEMHGDAQKRHRDMMERKRRLDNLIDEDGLRVG